MNKVKESLRKSIVSLKRNPSTIPMVMLLAAFLVFSLNLTDISDTTAKIQGAGMGLAEFTTMLLSLLAMVSLLNAFPRRKKPNIPMIVLLYVMLAAMAFADNHYLNAIYAAVTRPENPIEQTEYIVNAFYMLQGHMAMLGVTAALVATLPIYSKWLKKINTSVTIEENDAMGEIEISE